jgi:hypothetical protein
MFEVARELLGEQGSDDAARAAGSDPQPWRPEQRTVEEIRREREALDWAAAKRLFLTVPASSSPTSPG